MRLPFALEALTPHKPTAGFLAQVRYPLLHLKGALQLQMNRYG